VKIVLLQRNSSKKPPFSRSIARSGVLPGVAYGKSPSNKSEPPKLADIHKARYDEQTNRCGARLPKTKQKCPRGVERQRTARCRSRIQSET
jgi:hypothetical protein